MVIIHLNLYIRSTCPSQDFFASWESKNIQGGEYLIKNIRENFLQRSYYKHRFKNFKLLNFLLNVKCNKISEIYVTPKELIIFAIMYKNILIFNDFTRDHTLAKKK